jgi:hypothetical protein
VQVFSDLHKNVILFWEGRLDNNVQGLLNGGPVIKDAMTVETTPQT